MSTCEKCKGSGRYYAEPFHQQTRQCPDCVVIHENELDVLRAFVVAFDAWDEHFESYERWKTLQRARAAIKNTTEDHS